ncbi:MAG: imidazole glycerol phosphate synthase subunit HisH [Chitinophagaceae bacterium]|nr:imidazole glycerol phosphate synthase subunit HisH [Chitinophagaceae bacterium]
MITIIDYGIGNLTSIQNMLKKIGVESVISTQREVVAGADKLILPGVGSFDYGMQQLHQAGFVEVLNERVLSKRVPILGLCLGVQLLTAKSEEGVESGLGWIKGKTIAFDKSKLSSNEKIPHMGWSEIKGFERSTLFTGMYDEPRFYFVHSYHLQLENTEDTLAITNYGYDFSVGIERGNILGVQFHPEKSHKFGMKLLENFAKYY